MYSMKHKVKSVTLYYTKALHPEQTADGYDEWKVINYEYDCMKKPMQDVLESVIRKLS